MHELTRRGPAATPMATLAQVGAPVIHLGTFCFSVAMFAVFLTSFGQAARRLRTRSKYAVSQGRAASSRA
jgi:hypothetical protein